MINIRTWLHCFWFGHDWPMVFPADDLKEVYCTKCGKSYCDYYWGERE